MPAALIAWARGEQPDASWLKIEQGVKSVKCEQIIVLARLKGKTESQV